MPQMWSSQAFTFFNGVSLLCVYDRKTYSLLTSLIRRLKGIFCQICGKKVKKKVACVWHYSFCWWATAISTLNPVKWSSVLQMHKCIIYADVRAKYVEYFSVRRFLGWACSLREAEGILGYNVRPIHNWCHNVNPFKHLFYRLISKQMTLNISGLCNVERKVIIPIADHYLQLFHLTS